MNSVIKLIIFFILIAITMVVGAYYYLYHMDTTNGNLNISKLNMTNKIYSYNVYEDFYFNAKKYDTNGHLISEYRELQPLKTEIGYDLSNSNAKLIVKTNLNGEKTILSDINDNKLSNDINIINK